VVAELTCSSHITGVVDPTGPNDLGGADYSCGSPFAPLPQEGPEDVYTFRCQQSGVVSILLTDLLCDIDLYVLSTACDPVGGCLAGATAANALDDQVSFSCDADTTYFVVAEAFGLQGFPSAGACDTAHPTNYTLEFDVSAGTGCAEDCVDGMDNDLNGLIDCDDPACAADPACGLCGDNDGDGFLDAACGGTDCDDAASLVFPGAPEQCNGLDDDCDGQVPNDPIGGEFDDDGDGFAECDGDCNDAVATAHPGAIEVCDGADSDCDGVLPAIEADDDLDGVWVCAGDCDDLEPTIHAGAPELCDGIDNDCDGLVPNGPGTGEFDDDADGLAECDGDCVDTDANSYPGATEICDGLDNDCDTFLPMDEMDIDMDAHLLCGDDCDDYRAFIHPGHPEYCDGWDNDCNGLVDDGPSMTFYRDADGDGFGDPGDAVVDCAPPPGYVADGTDCDDTTGAVYPGAIELCDNRDNDCDGLVSPPEIDVDGDGWTTCFGDCYDNDPAFYPGAPEICDGWDNDCDGVIDNGMGAPWYRDNDGDGFGDPNTVQSSCVQPPGFVSDSSDCNDFDDAVHPAAPEICSGVDDNCDGVLAPGESDADGDLVLPCLGDCDDSDPNVYPSAPELCNGTDDDCDGGVDEGVLLSFHGDADGDGFGNPNVTAPGCAPSAGFVANSDDCDDAAATVFPGALERCNGIDDDCDGGLPPTETDDDGDGRVECDGDCLDVEPAIFGAALSYPTNGPANTEVCDLLDNDCDGLVDENGPNIFYRDADGDGFGDPTQLGNGCTAPPGFSADNTDCNDQSLFIHPGAPEICDRFDNDCDGAIPADEFDNDGDSWAVCEGDCDDANTAVHPAAPEICDGLDNNCFNGIADEGSDDDGDGFTTCVDCDDGDPSVHPGAPEICNGMDDDCDPSSWAMGPGAEADDDGDGRIECDGDCDDTQASVYGAALGFPAAGAAAVELCDNLDNDCDGQIDEGLEAAYHPDGDGDGYGDPASVIVTCSPPLAHVLDASDCDDQRGWVHPGAAELCDGLDDDCDGWTPPTEVDNDGDGRVECDGDCDDSRAQTYGPATSHPAPGPAAPDICDGIDNNCDGVVPPTEIDNDGDGRVECDGDCDDSRGHVYGEALAHPAPGPAAPELCDGIDNNCDGAVDEAGLSDADGDGHHLPGSCNAPDDDCDDADASVHPGAPEIPYDGVDQDCDGSDLTDLDGDGFDGGPTGPDCHDFDPDVHPGALEGPSCDGVDSDCDGRVDDGLPCTDDDGDGFSELQGDCDDSIPDGAQRNINEAERPGNGIDDDCDGLIDEDDADGDGFGVAAGDCNDGDPAVSPGSSEGPACDGVDNDCNGLVDDGLPCSDADGDGVTEAAGDCDDADPDTHPGATEQADFVDDDCDGLVDEGTAAYDDDGDGYCEGIDLDGDGRDDCSDGALPGDCADSPQGGAAVHPGAAEIANDGIDNDCDGVDHRSVPDADGDGFGDAIDCEPLDPDSHPGANEVADGVDNDCDGTTDEETRAYDDDGDGFCEGVDLDGDGSQDCSDGAVAGDCDDTSVDAREAWPGAPEMPDGRDQDCDGLVDEGTDLYDDDGDGYSEFGGDCDDGDPEVHPGAVDAVNDGLDADCDGADPVVEEPELSDIDGDGFSAAAGDCHDGDPEVHPAAPERCGNGIDDDCDGLVDPEDACVVDLETYAGGGCRAAQVPDAEGRWRPPGRLGGLAFVLLLGPARRRREGTASAKA
jgi:hypothetical protein